MSKLITFTNHDKNLGVVTIDIHTITKIYEQKLGGELVTFVSDNRGSVNYIAETSTEATKLLNLALYNYIEQNKDVKTKTT